MEALMHSANAFFNSFFMESSLHEMITFNGKKSFVIPLQGEELIVPVDYYSQLGRHHYSGDFYLRGQGTSEKISFEMAVRKLLNHLASSDDLYGRVFESLSNITTILNNRQDELSRICEGEADFISAEQALFAGHAFHPAPKSRLGFTNEDARLYSPEEKASFPLKWFFIKEDLLFEKHSNVFSDPKWMTDFFTSESSQRIPIGYLPFPCHPWQAKRLSDNPVIKEYIQERKIIEAHHVNTEWKATSSLRSLYRKDARYMLKFSMDVKLTNSIRHMLLHELERGLQVQEIMMSVPGKKFLSEHPCFDVMFEPVFIAIRDRNNQPMKETFVMARENISHHDSSSSFMLAYMTQDHPTFKGNFIQHEIKKYAEKNKLTTEVAAKAWLHAILNTAIKPLLHAQANYGILLGAHQQNLIIRLKDHLPIGAIFRDCHGTGLSPLGQVLFEEQTIGRDKNGNLMSEEIGNYLFSYYLVINSLFNILAAIARFEFVPEKMVINETRLFLSDLLNSGVKDPSCLHYLLKSPKLKHKGNFFCSLKNINENTTDNPLSIYKDINNPFYIQENI